MYRLRSTHQLASIGIMAEKIIFLPTSDYYDCNCGDSSKVVSTKVRPNGLD